MINSQYLNSNFSEMHLYKNEFDLRGFAKIPELIQYNFQQTFAHFLETAEFRTSEYEIFLKDSKSKVHEMVTEGNLVQFLTFALNDLKLIKTISDITSIPELKGFRGRLYKLEGNSEQALGWHDDVHPGKRVAISINLSLWPYQGGVLEIEKIATGELHRIPNLVFGDAVIFLIGREYRHRVPAVIGENPKISFTGWFLDNL